MPTTATVITSQLGARMHYAIPRMLHRAGRLHRCYTDICGSFGWPRWLRRLPAAWQPVALRRLTGRLVPDLPRERVVSFAGLGLAYAWQRYGAHTPGDETRAAIWAGQALSRAVLARGFDGANGVVAYSGECLELLQAAHKAGLWTAVEQTIAPRPIVDRILAEEHEAFPGWQMPLLADAYANAFAARERSEWEAADLILCGSTFVRDGIAALGGPADRCIVVPYGVDARFAVPQRPSHGGPLRVLTVGEVGLRKGSPYVIAAARRLAGGATFRMVGTCSLLPEVRSKAAAAVEFTGPVPRAEILRHFAWADIFLLPSMCEGSATVVYEALAAGLPVICTANTGSVVRDGIDGYIVPIRDVEAIVDRLQQLATNANVRREMSDAAISRAANFSLQTYSNRLLAALPAAAPPPHPYPDAASAVVRLA